MTEALVILGASGFGRETIDVLEAVNRVEARFQLLGVLDDGPSDINLERLRSRNVPYLGRLDDFDGASHGRTVRFVVAIGSPPVRERLARIAATLGLQPATLVHPTAVVGTECELGPGVVVCSGVLVSTNVRVGAHAHLNPGAVVGHDTVLGNYVSVNPRAVVSGDCIVEELALLGAGSVVLQGLRVGARAVVGAAACVVRDVPPDHTARGVPARTYPSRAS